MDILQLDALSLAEKLRGGARKVAEALDAAYAAIDASENNCYVTLCREEAYRQAAAVQAKLDAGLPLSPLAGVPIAVKDNICTKDTLTTCASKTLANFQPFYNAHVLDLIAQADMLVLGKTNLDEFGIGSTTETSYFGESLNPRNPAYTPSDGAAAVAAGEAWLALGSDTAGSIRQPGAFCGLTGLRPTYGSVSRRGLVAFASSMDQIGPIARNALDCAALYSLLLGKDPGDATSVAHPGFDLQAVKEYSAAGKKIGIIQEFFEGNLREDITTPLRAAAETLREQGAEISEISLPVTACAAQACYILSCAEVSSNLARFDGIKFGYVSPDAEELWDIYIKSRSEGFGEEVKRRILLGNFFLGAGQYEKYYENALRVKRLVRDAFAEAFKQYDMLLAPVASGAVRRRHAQSCDCPGCVPSVTDSLWGDYYTAPASLAGLPALSIPCGQDAQGLPVGMQLIAKPFAEAELLGMAQVFQGVTT